MTQMLNEINNIRLDEIIQKANQIYETFTNDFMFEELGVMDTQLTELKNMSDMLNHTSTKITHLTSKAFEMYYKRIHKFKRKLAAYDEVECPNALNDNYNPIISDINMQLLITPDKHLEPVAPDVNIPVLYIDSIQDLPDHNIYYITSLGQFAIKINGCVFRGNIGNIITPQHKIDERINKNLKKVISECDYGKKCTFISSKSNNICNFYHDPIDYDNFDETLLKDRKQKNIHIRNFLVQSWIYTIEPSTQKTKHMRHIGSRNDLSSDISLIDSAEKRKLKAQTIHDILVSIAINHYSN